MTLVRWKPIRDMANMQDEMNHAFASIFGPRSGYGGTEDTGSWNPDVDIVEDNDQVSVSVDLPGINKEDIQVQVEDNVLTIKGERKFAKDENQKNYHHMKRAYGSFYRTFSLPSTVAGDKIKANYKNGVLNIELPKIEDVKPKEIPISID